MDLVRSLSSSISRLAFSQEREPDAEALDALACLSCENPCEEHPWVSEAMQAKLNMTKVLRGTCKRFAKTRFLCSGQSGAVWAPKPGKGDLGLNADKTDVVMAELGKRTPPGCMLYVASTDAVAEPADDEFEVLLFPEHCRVAKVKVANFAELERLPRTPLTHDFVFFVCTHAKRDKRCGVAGKLVFFALCDAIVATGSQERAVCYEMSHVGGHSLAGNVLVYPGGHLYGRVRVCHVQQLLASHLHGEIIQEIYRGSQFDKVEELF